MIKIEKFSIENGDVKLTVENGKVFITAPEVTIKEFLELAAELDDVIHYIETSDIEMEISS